MKCAECGGVVEPSNEPIEAEYRKERFVVNNVPHRKCSSCGAIFFCGDELDEYSLAIDSQYRSEKGLLSKQAIKELREQLGLTQRELQKLVGVSDPTVSRWETGASPQNPTADKLMRVMRDVPEAVELLLAMEGLNPRTTPAGSFDTQWNKEVEALEMGKIEWIV